MYLNRKKKPQNKYKIIGQCMHEILFYIQEFSHAIDSYNVAKLKILAITSITLI